MAREDTRARIVAATLTALKERGFAGTSTRAIARAGGFGQPLIFYYFASLDDLLIAALEESSAERLERHRAAAEATTTISELVALLSAIYREDVETGFIRVASEMVGAGVARPELAPRVLALMEPWIQLAQNAVERVLVASGAEGLGGAVSSRELALAGVTFYLGANLLTHLEPEPDAVSGLFETAERLAPLADLLAASSLGPPAT